MINDCDGITKQNEAHPSKVFLTPKRLDQVVRKRWRGIWLRTWLSDAPPLCPYFPYLLFNSLRHIGTLGTRPDCLVLTWTGSKARGSQVLKGKRDRSKRQRWTPWECDWAGFTGGRANNNYFN